MAGAHTDIDLQHAQDNIATMLAADRFSAWLGIRVLEIAPSRVLLEMEIRSEMVNGFGVCHGGITYAFGDSALAFASNTAEHVCVSIDNAISYPNPVYLGDILRAEAVAEHVGKRISHYRIRITRQDNLPVALMHGTTYKTQKSHAQLRAERCQSAIDSRK